MGLLNTVTGWWNRADTKVVEPISTVDAKANELGTKADDLDERLDGKLEQRGGPLAAAAHLDRVARDRTREFDAKAAAKTAELDAAAGERLNRMRRAVTSVEAAAITGILAAIQISISTYLLQSQPDANTSSSGLTAWYADGSNRQEVLWALNLAPVRAISFLWFIAVVRKRLGEREDQFYATVFLGSGLLLAVLTVAAAVAAAVPVLVVEYGNESTPSRDVISLAHSLWYGLYVICAARFAAVFMFVTSTIGMRFGALPRWVGLLGYAMAVVLFITGAFSGPLAELFPIWLVIVSVTLLVTIRRAAD